VECPDLDAPQTSVGGVGHDDSSETCAARIKCVDGDCGAVTVDCSKDSAIAMS
jgi:hypothetical protein